MALEGIEVVLELDMCYFLGLDGSILRRFGLF